MTHARKPASRAEIRRALLRLMSALERMHGRETLSMNVRDTEQITRSMLGSEKR